MKKKKSAFYCPFMLCLSRLPFQSKPERQILSSLCEPALGLGSQSSVTSNIHQVQQRAPMLTSTVNGGQAFVSFTSQRNPETQTNAVHTTWAPPITQPVPVLNGMRFLAIAAYILIVATLFLLLLFLSLYLLSFLLCITFIFT